MWIKTVRLFLFRRESRRESMSFTEQIGKCFSGEKLPLMMKSILRIFVIKTALQEALSSLHLVEQSIADGMPEGFTRLT